jgi:hypothetical protein
MNGAWFLIFGAHFMVQGAVKDSAFLGVRLADGLKLDTTSLGLRTKVCCCFLNFFAFCLSLCCCMCLHSVYYC